MYRSVMIYVDGASAFCFSLRSSQNEMGVLRVIIIHTNTERELKKIAFSSLLTARSKKEKIPIGDSR